MNKQDIAFVAMKFNDTPTQRYLSRSRVYKVVSECLEEAGFVPIRGDKILSSGPSVDEISDLMRTASLVVIDTTGDSHSVAYELGYCHGIGRQPKDILLIRQDDGSTIPFNYRHYRHRTYRNLKHLRQLIREWFSISMSLLNNQHGFVLNFMLLPNHSPFYGSDVAEVISKAIKKVEFSGRCEYYSVDALAYRMPDVYLVGLGLKPQKKAIKLTHDWWKNFIKVIADLLSELDIGICLDDWSSEMGLMMGIRESQVFECAIEFSEGNPRMVIDESKVDSWFAGIM